MIRAIGRMALFFVTGKAPKFTGNYLPVFIMARVAYVLAVGLVDLLVPKLEPAKIDEAQPPSLTRMAEAGTRAG